MRAVLLEELCVLWTHCVFYCYAKPEAAQAAVLLWDPGVRKNTCLKQKNLI